MGTSHTYRCNKCDYQVLTSAGLDFGMVAVTDTYICENCHEIVDVCVGEYGEVYVKGDAALKQNNKLIDLDFYSCPECISSESLVKWNKRLKPCPKCQGTMGKDKYGEFILWD